uniref:Fukutin n=1 Tax=Bursaphelenchus xylophilus TaxID=6326 RepID=A0A1I7SFR6_BURXY
MQSLSSSSDVDSANKGESDSNTEYIPALRRHTHASSALMINVITRGSARPTQRQMEQPKASQNMSEAGTSGSGEFGRPEKLLIDLDCFNRLSKNLPCQAPLQVASFSNTSVSSHFSPVYRLSRDTTHDFTTFTPLNATHPTRLIVNFEFWKPKEIGLVNGEQVEVAVPDDLDAFTRKWHKSEAIECTGIGAKNRLFWDARRVLPLRVVKEVMAPFRDFCDRNNRTAFITSGSLLGWYRECSIIPHTTDIDFGLMISNYSREFEHLLDRNYELFWALGDGNTSMELSFHVGNVKTDLFFLFDYNSTHSYFSGMLVSARKELFWIYPKIDRICAGNLLGSLMYVPCNTEEFLRADYGPDWMVDSPSRKYYFDKSGKNIMPGKTFTKQQWRHVYRQLRGYKKHSS